VFAISLQSQVVSKRWDEVERNLHYTLRSAQASRSVNPVIIIACHEAPDLGDCGGKNVHMVPVPFPPELDVLQRIADKMRKRMFTGAWLKANLPCEGIYMMFLDADDLVHKDLAAHILEHDNRRSYLIDKGYRYDCSSGLMDRRSSEFYRVSASSFIGYFTMEDLPSTWNDRDAPLGRFDVYPYGHGEYGAIAAQMGKCPDMVPFHAVTYLMNHGESLRLWKTNGKFRHLSVGDLVRPSRAKQILADDFAFESGDWASWDMHERVRVVRVFLSACMYRARKRVSAAKRE
jgi:hypothetical protein